MRAENEAPPSPPALLVLRIVRRDGETVVTRPAWKEAMEAFDREYHARERARKQHELSFADLGPVEREKVRKRRMAEYRRREREALHVKPGAWEGPRLHVTVEYGLSHPWDGPDATRVEVPVVDADGFAVPVLDASGAIVGMETVTRCRGCGHVPELPPGGLCHHCLRSGMDDHPEVRTVQPKLPDPRPRDRSVLAGGVA